MPNALVEKVEVGDQTAMCNVDRFRLAIYDPTDPDDIEYVGDPFSCSPKELAEIHAAIRDYYAAIDGRDVPYSVGVFPVEAG